MATYTAENIKKSKLTGSGTDDIINISEYTVIPNKNGVKKGVTINALGGNDEITGSSGNDVITGGAGRNIIFFKGEFGNDTIKISKNETCILDFSDYGFENTDNFIFDASNGKNLIITVKDNLNTYGTITVANYVKKKISGAQVLVKLNKNGVEQDIENVAVFNYTKENFKKGVFNGTRFSETIDASGFTSALGKKNKGVTINGGAGYNTIIGTDGFNDTITGGNDGNNITTGDGNKKITTGSGNDIINIEGRGTHTIKAGGGTNTISINNSGGLGNITVCREKGNAKNIINLTSTNYIKDYYTLETYDNDLKIVDNYDKITQYSSNPTELVLKDYFLNNSQTEYEIRIKNEKKEISDLVEFFGGITISGNSILRGTDFADNITPAGKKNVSIYAGKGDDIINLGLGKRKMYFYSGDGNDIVKNSYKEDTLVFQKGEVIDVTGEFEKNGIINLILRYGNGDSVTLTNYKYAKDNRKNIQIGSKTKKLTSLKGVGKELIFNTISNKPLSGTKGIDKIFVGVSEQIVRPDEGDDYVHASACTIDLRENFGHDLVEGNGNLFLFDRSTTINDVRLVREEELLRLDYKGGENSVQVISDELLNLGHGRYYDKFYNCGVAAEIESKIYYFANYVQLAGNYGQYDGVAGTAKDDLLLVSQNPIYNKNTETIYSFEGNDIISAENLTAYAGEGNDIVEGSDGAVLYGENGDDILFGTSNTTLYGGEGNDILYGDAKYDLINYANTDLDESLICCPQYTKHSTTMYGGEGNDTYHIMYGLEYREEANPHHLIEDSSGVSDSLVLHTSKNEIKVFANISKNGTCNDNLYIRNTYVINSTHVGEQVYNNTTTEIKNYFTTGKIESITTVGNRYYTDNSTLNTNNFNLDSIKSDVANWLNQNDYADVQAVLDTNKTKDVNAIMAYFSNFNNWSDTQG